jgi:hypothetical protein
MVLDLNGEALFVGIEAWTAGHRPALHHPVEFEPQVVVQPSGRVLLDHIMVAVAAPFATARLRGNAELPFFAVGLERHGISVRQAKGFCDQG